MIGKALTTLLIGVSIGIIWLPVGYCMGVLSVKKVAEADRAEEAPEFVQQAAQSQRQNNMALSAKDVEQRYNEDQ